MGDANDEDALLHRNPCLDHDYWIAQTPTSVAQFRQFVESSGYPGHAAECLQYPENRPVCWVSWHDALAFCAWLTERWRKTLPAGWRVSLPSEAEWEKAARGGEQIPLEIQATTAAKGFAPAASAMRDNPSPQREYPWGSDWAPDSSNAEMNVGNASSPGCFETGRSPYACEDMAGNLWEWTRSLWGKDWGKPEFTYPYLPDDRKREDLRAGNDVLRLVRGGSWSYNRAYARCAVRSRLSPRQPQPRPRFSGGVAFCPCS